MKKLSPIILLLPMLASAIVNAALPAIQERFDRAGRLYEEGRYSEALTVYSALESGTKNWKIYYDMGNCHYKLRQFLDAKVCYLKARKYRPLDSAIERNILIVSREFKDALPAEKPDFVSRTLERLEATLTLDATFLTLFLLILILNLCLFLILKKGGNKTILYGLSFSLILCLLFSGYLLNRISRQGETKTAVIAGENSTLRSGPGESNTILFKVNPGLEVRIIDGSRNWYQVSASQQIAGWIEESRLKLI